MEEEKMKRLKYVMLLGIVLVLGACSKAPKEEFVDAYQEIKKEAQYAGEFDVSIPEFAIGQESNEELEQELVDTLKNFSVKGNYYSDEENNYQFDMTLNVLNEKIPLKLLGNEETAYLSTSFIDGTLEVMKSFDVEAPIDTTDLTQLDKKYIEVPIEMAKGFANIEDSAELEESPNDEAVLDELLEKAKKDSFKKKGDTITHTFSAAELEQLGLNEQLDNVRQTKLTISSLLMKINLKTKETAFVMEMKDNETAMQLTGMVKVKPKKKKKISLPKYNAVLSLTEVQELLTPLEEDVTDITEEPADISEEDLKYTDEEFEPFYAEIEAYLPEMSEEEKEAMLSNYQIFLTEEQYSRLEALLRQE